MMISLLLLSSLVSLSLSLSSIIVNVTNTNDYYGDVLYCINDNNTCNFRSAIVYCNIYSDPNVDCQIVLQPNSIIAFNSSLGHNEINASANIHVLGYSSTIEYININDINDEYDSTFLSYTEGNGAVLVIDHVCFSSFYTTGISSIIYINGSIVITISNTIIINSYAYGSSLYFNNTNDGSITIIDSSFINNYSDDYGASIYYDYNVNNITIIDSSFINNQASYAGSIFFNQYSSNIDIRNTLFLSNQVINYGGVIQFGNGDIDCIFENITIYNSTFLSNKANYGSCIATATAVIVRYFNVDESYFKYNYASKQGGVYFLDGNLSDAVFKNSYYILNKAVTTGGCINLYNNATRVLISSNVFQNNTSNLRGADLCTGNPSKDVIVDNNTFTFSTNAAIYVPGTEPKVNTIITNNFFNYCVRWLEIRSFASNLTISDNVFFFNKWGTNSGVDFGIYITSFNNNITINNNNISFSNRRPALYIDTGNTNITISNCYFYNNTNSFNGGAIFVNKNNTQINIINTTFDSNSATNGGAVYSALLNPYLTLVDCKFDSNSASINGGAVSLGQSHTSFVVMNYQTYRNYLQVQTTHPYISKAPINNNPSIVYSNLITVQDAVQFVITFDSRTELWFYDSFYLYTDNTKATLLYKNIGNAAWPGVSTPNLIIYSNQFYIEIVGPRVNYALPTTYWGFLINAYPIFSQELDLPLQSLFINNSAQYGGGIHCNFLITFPIIVNTDFIDNTAGDSGGGLSMFLSNYGPTLKKLRFISNRAQNGGGLSFASSNYGCQISECYFFNNSAEDGGAGVFFGAYNGQGLFTNYNEITINASEFLSNTASKGGAVSTFYENVLLLNDVSFLSNIAYNYGGALAVDTSNSVNITSTRLTSNKAGGGLGGGGGGLASKVLNTISINDSVFSHNTAAEGSGGGLWLDTASSVTFLGRNVFSNCSASVGGAISSGTMWSICGTLYIVNNSAELGSAIALAFFSDSETVLTNITMEYNKASKAGTIFWLCSGIKSCTEPRNSGLVFSNNTAPYGITFGTQPITIESAIEYNVSVYQAPLNPAISLSLYDFYGQRVISDNDTIVDASVYDYSCNQLVGTLASSTVETSKEGMINFNDITAFCNPLGNLTILYTAKPYLVSYFDVADQNDYNVVDSSILNFRNCRNGEKYLNGACIKCANGTYSLQYEEDGGCIQCPKESSGCYANNIDLIPGFWRINEFSDTILRCPFPTGCIGGVGVNEKLCATGYESVLCAVCSNGYYYNNDKHQCITCNNIEVLSPSLIIVFVVLFIIILVCCIYAYVKFVKSVKMEGVFDNDDINETAIVGNTKLKSIVDKMNKLNERVGPLMAKLKIVISTFQIISTSLQSFSIQMPTSYVNFLSCFNFLSFDMFNFIPLGCVKRFTFIESLMVKTLFPPACIAMIFVIFMLEFFIRRKKVLKSSNNIDQIKATLILLVSNLKFRYISLSLLFSYMYLPGLTVSIFTMFICENIDPTNEVYPNGDYYLVADYSINCNSTYMTFGRIYAGFMIVVYPIGVPCLYFYLLFRKRYELKHRDDLNKKRKRKDVKKKKLNDFLQANAIVDNATEGTQGTAMIKRSTATFKFLYDSYKPQYWYFEIVETTRRLMLTAALSVIASGSSTQVVCGILLSLGYMKIYSYYQPYALDESSTLAELAQYQIFFSFFGSLIIQNSLLPSSLNTCVSIVLILLNLSTSMLAAYFEYRGSKNKSNVEPIKENTTDDTNVYSSNDNGTDNETSNPLQHRVDMNNNTNERHDNDVNQSDLETANDHNNSTPDSDDSDDDDNYNKLNITNLYRDSHVQEIISQFELKKFSHPSSSNIVSK